MAKKRARFITAVITIAAFLSTSIPISAAPVGPTIAPSEFDISAFSLPAGLGDVSTVFKGTNGKTILHIQDAHCNYSAQHSIAEIISNLSANYKADIVFLEGGRGPYDFSIFDRVKDPLTKERVSDYFVKEGIVTGAEFFAINNPGRVELFGIEDDGLYFENLKTYRNSLAFKKEADSYLKTLSAALANLKLKAYSPALKALDEKIASHRDYKTDFKSYAVFLKDKAAENNIPIANYKNLALLFDTIRVENTINFKAAEKERGVLVDRLGSVLAKNDLKELKLKMDEYKAGDVSSETFYGYLLRKANLAGADLKTMPNLVKYSLYLKNYESIDKPKLLKEIKDIEGSLFDKLARTDDQRIIYRLDRTLEILKGIFNTSLVKEDFDYYNARKADFDVDNFTGFFIKRGPVYGLRFTPDEKLKKLDIYRGEMEKFYSYSLLRDDAFLKNIEAKLAGNKKNIAILVTGGFHSANLSRLFKDKGYSYARVMPKFKADQGDSPYFNLLAGGSTPTDEFLKTAVLYTPAKSMLAIETPFSQMPVPEFISNMLKLKIGIQERLAPSVPAENRIFVIQTPTGFITITSAAQLKNIIGSLDVNGVTYYAAFSPSMPENAVNAVLLDKENMRWEPGKGIIEEEPQPPGQGPQAVGARGREAVPEYSQIVTVIGPRTGMVEVGVGAGFASGQTITTGETVRISGQAGLPFQVLVLTALAAVDDRQERYIAGEQLTRGLNAAEIDTWGEAMKAFEKDLLTSLAERPFPPDREFSVYVEVPEQMMSKVGQERAGLAETVQRRKIGQIEFTTFTPDKREGIAEEIAAKADKIGKDSIATFALKNRGVPENAADKKMRMNSYTVYMQVQNGMAYVPVRVCGMTALKIFDCLDLAKQPEPDMIKLNQAVELVARGIGLISGTDYKAILNLISETNVAGMRELLQSGHILVAITPVNINELDKTEKMSRAVRAAA